MKRQFFAIILLLISFSFIFSTKSFAIDCCNPGKGSPISGEKCAVMGGSIDNSCIGTSTPYCDIPNNTCVANEPSPTPTPTDNPQTANCNVAGDACCVTSSGGQMSVSVYCGNGLECIGADPYHGIAGTCYASNNTPTPSPTYINPVGIKDIFCISGQRDSGIMTALGCIKTSGPNDLITSILRIATGIGGGIALALILYGVFIVTTSAGMPDKLKAGSEIITSAIIGLIFILLSVFLINLIGINILGIPGLSNT